MTIQLERMPEHKTILIMTFQIDRVDTHFVSQKSRLLEKRFEPLSDENIPVKAVIISFKGVEFIDDPGIGFFCQIIRFFRNKHIVSTVIGLSERLRLIFELTRLDRAIQIYEGTQEAIEMLKTIPFPKTVDDAYYLTLPEASKQLYNRKQKVAKKH